METPITLWLSETEAAALADQARRYSQTDEQRVWVWVRDALDQAMKDHQAQQWEKRRRKLAADAALAAQVDAAP